MKRTNSFKPQSSLDSFVIVKKKKSVEAPTTSPTIEVTGTAEIATISAHSAATSASIATQHVKHEITEPDDIVDIRNRNDGGKTKCCQTKCCRQNVADKMSTDKMLRDKMLLRQNVARQNVADKMLPTKC